jgi:hypothetical protein
MRYLSGIHKFAGLAVVLVIGTSAFATTWFVDGINGSDGNTCKSFQMACKTIGHAISLAVAGDSIMIGNGTYPENLNIASNISLIAYGTARPVIDGRHVNTVITISDPNAVVTLWGLVIQNGSAPQGGGVHNVGKLFIGASAITFNTATTAAGGGGIYNSGTLTVSGSAIGGNKAIGSILHPTRGGGVYNVGTLTVAQSSIAGNSLLSGKGGGIYSDSGTVTINRSTISGNSSGFEGGGIEIGSGTLYLNNSTVAGNSTPYGSGPGGIAVLGGATKISNSTISANSAKRSVGGIAALRDTTAIQNSIVANNSPADCGNFMNSLGYNLNGDTSCGFYATGDLRGVDPKLGALQYNGGTTQTIALLDGSPAIDAGNPGGCRDGVGVLLTTDQRGMPRPDPEDPGGCDMGAYERQSD